MATSLNDVLSEEPAETTPEKPTAEPAAQETPSPAPEASEKPPAQQAIRKAHQEKEMDARGFERDPETGQFLPKKTEAEKPETKPAEPPKVETPPQQQYTDKERRALIANVLEERRKRQEIEAKFKALEEKKPAEPDEPAQDFWQDPNGWLKSQQAALKAEAMRSHASTTLKVSEMLARSKYQDFDAAVAVFGELAEQTPGLGEQMLSSPDPAEFAYRTGKNHKELREAGSLDALKARFEKEARIKIEAEYKEQAEKRAAERAALPPSLSDARGTVVNKPVWNGPTPLDDILK